MKNQVISITGRDMHRLQNLLDNPDLMRQKPYLEQLERELNRAHVVDSAAIPANIITMNSTALLVDLETREEMLLTLVYPEHAYIPEGRISVLAPVGMAMLGCRQGEVVTWEVPEGIRSLRIDSILYQPEAAGEFSL
ncbi:MAG: nucleoside diphosphate kinase regulator [Anaerolineae bacterium]|jgi:regulator of nucleoside diphosphate kinase|nr:nucleoside diphosphate kinase regulator [Anaerolineae bacterium]